MTKILEHFLSILLLHKVTMYDEEYWHDVYLGHVANWLQIQIRHSHENDIT